MQTNVSINRVIKLRAMICRSDLFLLSRVRAQIKSHSFIYVGGLVRSETRDAAERLAADTVYVTVGAAQYDDDIAKLEQRQSAWSW